MKYLNFDNEEKGYQIFSLTRENIKLNIGKQICFVDKASIDKYRGYYNVDYGVIVSLKYSELTIDEYGNTLDIRDIVECGIKIDS